MKIGQNWQKAIVFIIGAALAGLGIPFTELCNCPDAVPYGGTMTKADTITATTIYSDSTKLSMKYAIDAAGNYMSIDTVEIR